MTTHARRLAALGAAAVLLLVSGCATVRSGWQAVNNENMKGRMAPRITGTDWVLDGHQVPNLTYTGRHTVVVFFDPTASASAGVMARVADLYADFASRGVVFIGLTDADRELLGFYTEDHPIPFPVLTEASTDRRTFGIKKLYEPEIFLIDPYQRVVADGLEGVSAALHEHFPD